MRNGLLTPTAKLGALIMPVALFLNGCADLKVTDVHYAPLVAHTLVVKATVENDGLRAAAPSTTRLDVKPTNSSTFTQRASIQTPALNGAQSIELSMSPLSPTELPSAGSGQCLELRVCADAGNSVPEGWFWEGNNCRTRSYCN